ncbi:hypothetical protein K523DRAFT_414831 [Schizophyllum commune Tattone D]|nr:hypothetical protein K523DRAFT_414831 [Schizophyllum commune Tattone D]
MSPAAPGSDIREMTSPIHCLPVELLAEVFRQLHASIVAGEPFPDPTSKLDKTVTRICKAWRRVAYDTPSLWTTYLAQTSEAAMDTHLERYLPLAKNYPLELVSPLPSHTLLAFIEKLRPYAYQWRAARLLAGGRELRSIKPLATPNLEYLYIETAEPDEIISLKAFEYAPRLRRLHVRASASLPEFVLELPSTARLTALKLDITKLNIPDILPTLWQCSETLEELELVVHYPHSGLSFPPTLVHLPALKRITLRYGPCDVLEWLSMPNVEEICLYCEAKQASIALQSFLHRDPHAAAHLRRLVIGIPSAFSVIFLHQCLLLTTNLEELMLIESLPQALIKLFHAITCRDNHPPLLPKLKSLDFYRSSMKEGFSYKEFAKSRASQRVVCGVEVAALRGT